MAGCDILILDMIIFYFESIIFKYRFSKLSLLLQLFSPRGEHTIESYKITGIYREITEIVIEVGLPIPFIFGLFQIVGFLGKAFLKGQLHLHRSMKIYNGFCFDRGDAKFIAQFVIGIGNKGEYLIDHPGLHDPSSCDRIDDPCCYS